MSQPNQTIKPAQPTKQNTWGGARQGAGRKPKPDAPKLKLREYVTQHDLDLLAADYAALKAVSKALVERLQANPNRVSTKELVNFQRTITSRINKTVAYYEHSSDNWLKLRYKVFQRDNFTCKYCGRTTLTDNIKLHADHILPRSKGGKDTLDNLITSCSECNLGKSDVLLEARNFSKVRSYVAKEAS